jgi:signal transduction histidine kinase
MDAYEDAIGHGDRAGSAPVSTGERGSRRPLEGPPADDRHSSRLITAFAHDIRTPLNAMLLTLHLLETKLDASMDDEDRADFAMLRAEIRAILDLYKGMLEHARRDRDRTMLDESEFSLDELVGSCVQVVQPLATQKGLAIIKDLRAGEFVRTDRTMLQHVVGNLLSNAIRYTREGHIAIRSRLDADVLRIEVEDTGIGIAPEDRPRIFDPYFRSRAARGEHVAESFGLGLSMARQMVRLLGGELTVSSEVGRGSLFTLALPKRTPGPPSEATPTREADGSASSWTS